MMRFHRFLKRRTAVQAFGLLLAPALLLLTLTADSANPALEVLAKTHEEGARSQARIDKLDDAMRRMRAEMQQEVLKREALRSQLPELERHAGEMAARRKQLEAEYAAGVPGQIDVQPTLEQTVDWLDKFVASDIPYQIERRRERVAGLKRLLDKDKVTDADKLRAVLEVTQVEIQYGRIVEVYTGQLSFGGESRDVEYLRIGRLMLYYAEIDGTRQGYWDVEKRRWQSLPAEERERLLTAMAMARGETPPELMELLLPVPEQGS